MGSNELPKRLQDTGEASTDEKPLPPFSAPWASGMRLAIAAAILLVVAGVLAVRTFEQPPSQITSAPMVTVSSAPGTEREVRVGDDAVVTLGGGSRIRYAVTRTRTDVELSGLARFRVAHSRLRVFDVRAKNARVVDLGTDFVIRSYDSDSNVTVGVLSGKIALNDVQSQARPERGRGRTVELKAGQLLSLSPDGEVSTVRPMHERTYAEWMRTGSGKGRPVR